MKSPMSARNFGAPIVAPANLHNANDAFETKGNLGIIIFIKGAWGVNQLVPGPVCQFQVVL
jgi:hypothetical protein